MERRIQTLKIFLLALFVCAMVSGRPAMAAETPSDALKSTIDTVLLTLKNPDYANKDKRVSLRAAIEQEVRSIFDFTEFSKRTLSSYWAKFSPDQQQRFANAFSSLLIATYLDKVNGYNGEKVVYLGERYAQNGKLAEVQTTITLSGGQVTPMAYRMLERDGKWQVYDVLIENVGLNSNYRSQFNEILAKSTPEDLIKKVEERAAEVRKQSPQTSS